MNVAIIPPSSVPRPAEGISSGGMKRLEPQFVSTHYQAILAARHRQQLIANHMDHFLTDVQTLRQRARQHTKEPADITPDNATHTAIHACRGR